MFRRITRRCCDSCCWQAESLSYDAGLKPAATDAGERGVPDRLPRLCSLRFFSGQAGQVEACPTRGRSKQRPYDESQELAQPLHFIQGKPFALLWASGPPQFKRAGKMSALQGTG